MTWFLVCLVLQGYVSTSSERGRCGFMAHENKVTIIYKFSPSQGKLEVGDKVISCNGIRGDKDCVSYEGPGSIAHLVIERNGKRMEVDITRASFSDVHD